MNKHAVDLIQHEFLISQQDRNRIIGHRSFVVWFTGLSGAGKSTLANAIETKLYHTGCMTYVLDGDNIRKRLNADLDFSEKGRKENIRRAGEVCKLMVDAGVIVLAAFIAPFHGDRDQLRDLLGEDYVEIYIRCPIDVCERRDVKGFYKKAREGRIDNFTGIVSPYEEPRNPDLTIDTDVLNIHESVDRIYEYIYPKLLLA